MRLLPLLPTLAAAALLAVAAPASAAIPSGPTSRDPYEIFTIGDSYAAGEGSPDVNGTYDDNGDVQNNQFEDWDTRFGGSPAVPGPNQDSTRCHRSGHTSPSAVARQTLQDEFPDVQFDWTSVACAGASLVQTAKLGGNPPPNKGGILRGYDGAEKMGKRGIAADKLVPAVYPPQIDQLNSILSDRPNGPTKRIDALLMNLGGNDLGFAEIIAKCLNIVPFSSDCDEDEDVASFVSGKLGVLNGRFDRLANALAGTPQTGDPGLDFRPAQVFLTDAPNPLRPSASTFCDGTPKGNYEENLTAGEARWAQDNVLIPLNARFATEAAQHGWNIVDSFVDDFVGHALCSGDNWINQNLEGLHQQGELDETDGLPVAVSGGLMHPNVTGYAQIGAGLYARMRPFVIDRYTPDAAPVTNTTARATGFTVSVGDGNLPALRGGYWHRIRLRQLNADGTVSSVTGADGLRDLPYGTTSIDYARTGRYLVTARACGPLSRTGARGCGPASAELRVSTFVPARPVGLEATPGDAPAAVMPTPGFTVAWEHANDFALHDTQRSVVRVRRKDTGATVATKTVEGTFTSTLVDDLQAGVTYLVAVKACNDGDRCSSFTPEVETTAKKGQKPFSGLAAELQQIKTAVKGVPCARTPIPFDPSLGPELPGFEDLTPSFIPSCPGDLPVGRLKLSRGVVQARAGRAATIALRWRAPRRWRDLHVVEVRFMRAGRTLASLRFDQDRGRIALAPGTRRHGRSLAAGRAGTLRARGIRVRLAADAVKGSGPAGRDVRLRLKVRLSRSAVLAVGASDDAGQAQPPVPAGLIRVR
jgi:hypothetical protein